VLEVRTALLSEHAAVGELTASTYLDEGFADEHYAGVLRDVDARAEAATVLVAVLDGRVIGSVTVATEGGAYAENADPGDAVIRMLVTHPAARGSGAGSALVDRALELAREAGCMAVRLSTQSSMTAAHRIYERLGFTRTPDRDWSPVPGVDLLTYVLPLVFCGWCGKPGSHTECADPLEPPRYCTQCRRRMVVQVHPTGWSARCVEHGTVTS
jgi:ribosomal protein S18 acetylase RimI-like enzyme